jgi:putative transport protein
MDVFAWIVETLRSNPELAIFLTLGFGYWLGNLTLGSFSLGTVTGTLIAGILVGQLGIEISPLVKSVFFMLFLFAVGYGVGPQFVRGVARDGVPQAIFAVVICLLVLASVTVAAMIAGYDPGYAAGLHAGSQTISASIGLATDAINALEVPDAERQAMLNHIPVAYAVAYIWGTVGTGWILATLGPKLLRIDLAAECARYERELGGAGAEGESSLSGWRQVELRAYRIREGDRGVGRTIAEVEAMANERDEPLRLYIERVRRDGAILEWDEHIVLRSGDVVALTGERSAIVELLRGAEEVEDRELLDVPAESVDVVVTRKDFDGKTLHELVREPFARGVYATRITRGAVAVEIPVLPESKVYRGDILHLVGMSHRVAAAAEAVGYADRPTDVTDMVWVGLGIALGGLLGALEFGIAGVPITLSTSGGALLAGLLIGWARSVHPTFGRVPMPSLWFMNSVGLNLFIAVVGISSGPTFVAGLQDAGISLFLWGLMATSVPMLLAPLIGKYVFGFDPAINLGCCGGARTSTASVGMVAEVARSNVPMLGYTVPYAVSNTLLTLWGMVVVLLIA